MTSIPGTHRMQEFLLTQGVYSAWRIVAARIVLQIGDASIIHELSHAKTGLLVSLSVMLPGHPYPYTMGLMTNPRARFSDKLP